MRVALSILSASVLSVACQAASPAPAVPAAEPSATIAPVAVSVAATPAPAQPPAAATNAPVSRDPNQQCQGTPPRGIADEVRARAALTLSCYEQALRRNLNLAGRIRVALKIAADGAVLVAETTQDEPGDSALRECVQRVLSEGAYSAPGNGCIDVIVPLSFTPKHADGGT